MTVRVESRSSDERALAFVADAPPLELEPFAGAFEYRAQLGEKYVGVSQPRVFVLEGLGDDDGDDDDVVRPLAPTRPFPAPSEEAYEREREKAARVDSWCAPFSWIYTVGSRLELPPGVAFAGSPEFEPAAGSRRLAFVGWRDSSPRLGLIYCYNRHSSVFVLPDARGTGGDARNAARSPLVSSILSVHRPPEKCVSRAPQAAEVTASDLIARSPRWRPGGGALAYLGSRAGFATHDGAVALRLLTLATAERGAETRTLVAEVSEPRDDCDESGGFPGIWGCGDLPADPWLSNDELFLNSLWRSSPVVLLVDATSGATSEPPPSLPKPRVCVSNA